MRQGTTPASAGPALSTRRLASAQIIGTTIEWYDFFIYGTASALVFNHVFFPGLPPLVGTLLALATFGAGFLARPLGAVIFGHFGDRVGRKRTLVVTLLLMGGATVAVGLLPSYGAIGVASPLLLLLLRIVQGMAVGGEWGGAALIGIEHATPRRKTLFGAFAQLGSPLGLVLATLVFMAVTTGSDAWLRSWGWRLPFLASVLLIPIGMAIRTKIHESPDFTAANEAPKPARLPVVAVLRQDWRRVLIGVGAFAGVFVTYYLLTTFTLVYATGTLGMSTSVTLPANLIAAVSEGLFVLIGALLAPRFGARRIAVASAIGLLIWAWPAFALVGTQNAALLYLGVAVSMAFVGAGLRGPRRRGRPVVPPRGPLHGRLPQLRNRGFHRWNRPQLLHLPARPQWQHDPGGRPHRDRRPGDGRSVCGVAPPLGGRRPARDSPGRRGSLRPLIRRPRTTSLIAPSRSSAMSTSVPANGQVSFWFGQTGFPRDAPHSTARPPRMCASSAPDTPGSGPRTTSRRPGPTGTSSFWSGSSRVSAPPAATAAGCPARSRVRPPGSPRNAARRPSCGSRP